MTTTTSFIATAADLERCARKAVGPLAQAIAGGTDNKAANALFLGQANVVPPRAARLLRLAAWANRREHVLARVVRAFVARHKVYGNLITTMLFANRRADDTIVAQHEQGRLGGVRLERPNGEHVEFVANDGGIRQRLYFGKRLPDGNDSLSLEYRYDGDSGALQSTGPQQINRAAWQDRQRIALPDTVIHADILAEFSRLSKQPAADSLTFAANCGILASALRQLQEPQLAIDFTRVVVHALHFVRSAVVPLAPADIVNTRVEPLAIVQCDKGELLQAAIISDKDGQEASRCQVTLLVRGNLPQPPEQRVAHIDPVRWEKKTRHDSEVIRVMENAELFDFAALNGDWNPLHQIDGVAQMVGFKNRINPGFGIAAEIEAALRRCLANPLGQLTATFVRPVYPGEEYLLCWGGSGDKQYRYQLCRRGQAAKVAVDGIFCMM